MQPCAVWALDETNSDGSADITGAVFDPARWRVYITENYGDGPVVHGNIPGF